MEASVHGVNETFVHDANEEAKNKKRHLNVVSIGHVGELTFHTSLNNHALNEMFIPLLSWSFRFLMAMFGCVLPNV